MEKTRKEEPESLYSDAHYERLCEVLASRIFQRQKNGRFASYIWGFLLTGINRNSEIIIAERRPWQCEKIVPTIIPAFANMEEATVWVLTNIKKEDVDGIPFSKIQG